MNSCKLTFGKDEARESIQYKLNYNALHIFRKTIN